MSDRNLVAKRKELSIKETGFTVSVPQNATAKLLYYLNCINCIIQLVELDYNFVSWVNDYKNCQSWTKTNQEKQKILRVARGFTPSILENKIFFKVTSLGDNSGYKFFEINSSEITVAASDEVFIGGLSKKIHKIMLYKSSWLQTNYYDAIRDLERELRQPIMINTQYNGLFVFLLFQNYFHKNCLTKTRLILVVNCCGWVWAHRISF
jgi:hypothetical protein